MWYTLRRTKKKDLSKNLVPDFFSHKYEVTFVIGVTIEDNESIDRALRRFKKKYERSGVLKEFKKRTYFTKPSIQKRISHMKAVRRQYRVQMEQQ